MVRCAVVYKNYFKIFVSLPKNVAGALSDILFNTIYRHYYGNTWTAVVHYNSALLMILRRELRVEEDMGALTAER